MKSDSYFVKHNFKTVLSNFCPKRDEGTGIRITQKIKKFSIKNWGPIAKQKQTTKLCKFKSIQNNPQKYPRIIESNACSKQTSKKLSNDFEFKIF